MKEYYVSHEKWYNNLDSILGKYLFDEKGVIQISTDVLKKNRIDTPDEGSYFYHPIVLTHYGLYSYDLFLRTNDEKALKSFINQVEGLLNIGTKSQNSLVYPFPYENQRYGVSKGWVSGMIQGEALSCFARAYDRTKDERFLAAAEAVFHSFCIPYDSEYGFMNEDEYGIWFEEVPAKTPPHILNGFIFAIFGLWDYYIVCKNPAAGHLAQKAMDTVENALEDYDTGYWSFYDLRGVMAPRKYHADVHIPQLDALFQITGNESFLAMRHRWERYSRSKIKFLMSRVSHICWKLSSKRIRVF